jgi:GGDEF domain-containing protein
VALAGLVGESLRDFEGAVEAISMPKVNERLLREDKARARINTEMRRARRHARPISAVAIDVDPATFEATLHQSVKDVQEAMVERYAKVRLGAFLARRVRETDLVVQQQQSGRFLLLAPETPADQTREFMKRLERDSFEQLGLRFSFGVADFPGSALTSEDLLIRAEEALRVDIQNTKDGSAPTPAPAA